MPRGRSAVEALVEGGGADAVVDHVTPAPPVSSRTALGEAVVAEHLVGAGSRASPAFSSVETVPITRAPRSLAIWVSSRPMPPAAAWTSTSSPGLSA